MNLAVFPLLLVALVMVAGNPEVDSVRVALDGDQLMSAADGAVIVVEAAVVVPPGVEVSGPIYVVGGTLTIEGTVTGEIVQLAGSVEVAPGGRVGGRLQHTAGTLTIAPTAEVEGLTRLDLSAGPADGRRGFLPAAGLTVLLATMGFVLTKKRTRLLDNVAEAIAAHPVVSLTVGLLLALTALSLFVFMALTLVLLPVAVVGLVIGILTLGYGIVAWGHLIGSIIPVCSGRIATAFGIVIAVVGVQVVGSIPILGDLAVAAVLLTGVGAALITYYGVSAFRPVVLGDE